MKNPQRGRLTAGDVVLLLVLVLATCAAGWLLTRLFVNATDAQVTTVLTNTATVGGIVSGLSLAGLSALSLTGDNLAKLQERFGSHVRALLLGMYGLAACVALACGVVAAFPEWDQARRLAGYAPPTLITLLVMSTFVVTSLYRLGQPGEPPREPRRPAPRYESDGS